jgi:hypothetical protein
LAEQLSTKVDPLLDFKAAKTLGLAVPVSLLGRADNVRLNKGANCCGARESTQGTSRHPVALEVFVAVAA